MLSLWGGPLAPWEMLTRVLGRPGRSGRYSGGARVISSCGSSAMVEAATVTIIARHLHHRILTKHEIVDRAAAASRSHDGAMVRALPTENPRQARGTECIRDDSILRVAECRMLIEAGAPASPASWSGPALRQKLASRLIRTWSGRLRVRAGQHGTRYGCLHAYLGHRNIQHTVRYTELSPTRFKDLWRCKSGHRSPNRAVPTATRLPAELALASAASGPPTVMNICHTPRCRIFRDGGHFARTLKMVHF